MKPRSFSFVPALLPSLCTTLAQAAEVGAGGTAPDLGSSALQMIFGLLVVLGLLIGSLWLLKRISQPRGPIAGLLRVVAGVAVGSRERVVIVELGNSWLVLGVAPGQVSTLAEIPRQEVPTTPETASAKDFSAWLKQVASRRDPR
jgi:flagellar protein FliO/FliZ